MLKIVAYDEKYRDDVRQVCLNTAGEKARTDKKEGNFILAAFCDYYLDCESGNCFVAVDENGVAQGYILCAPEFDTYKKNFKPYIKRAGESGFIRRVYTWGEMVMTGLFKKKYPAHLHIDINPGFQRMGVGTGLMNCLTDHLRKRGVGSVMLIVNANNTKGVNFYKKYGFEKIGSLGFGLPMGLDLE